MTLTRDQILAVNDRKRETVDVPEWGGSVIVSEMSGSDRERFHVLVKGVNDGADPALLPAQVVAFTVVDEAGEPVFKAEDVQALGRKNYTALDRVWKVALRLSGLTSEAQEAIRGN